jgi:hypothetical protein
LRAFICAVAAVLLTAQCLCAATGDPAVDALIEKLVQKGLITRDDAEDLGKDFRKPVADHDMKQTEPVQDAQILAGEKPVKASSKLDLPFDIKMRAQARLDAGDLLVSPEGRYRTETDLFLRRVRLELEKELKTPPFGKELTLNLTLEADRFDQDFRNGRRRDPGNNVGLQYLYGDWVFTDAFGLEIGKHKLPFLRVELTSSGRQLLIERPAVTGAAKDSLGDYHQAQVMAHGEVAGGALRYYFSFADGAANLDALQELDSDASSVQRRRWGNAYTGRIELAPLSFREQGAYTEKKRDDTGIGAESHLTFGFDYGLQQDIRYATETVADATLDSRVVSADLAGRYSLGAMGTVTGQLEYVSFKRDFNYRQDEKPQGGYLQAGYLLPWTLLGGRFEPALRYEIFDHDRVDNDGASGSKERTISIGTNHYLLKHSVKWAYNFVHTRFDPGVAEAANSRKRDLHQLLLQLYF